VWFYGPVVIEKLKVLFRSVMIVCGPKKKKYIIMIMRPSIKGRINFIDSSINPFFIGTSTEMK
jgi:hypothetical protein